MVLKSMPYAHAKVVISEHEITLVSYTTPVVIINRDTSFVHVTGLYSATTRRHISAFMREYCACDYSIAKKAVLGNFDFNFETGEIVLNS